MISLPYSTSSSTDSSRSPSPKQEGAMISLPYSTSSSSSSTDHSPTPSLKQIELKVDPDALPQKGGSTATRYLQHTFFSGYRRLFSVLFLANLAIFIGLIAHSRGLPPAPHVGAVSSANLMVAILFRQENFVNLLHEIATSVPHSTPLFIRTRLAYVFHYGGFHSGAGVAAVMWFLLYTAVLTNDFAQSHSHDQIAGVVTSYILVALFCGILVLAHPDLRARFHDHFEMMHRFAGWSSLATFWVHIVIGAHVNAKSENTTMGLYLVKSPIFWTLLITTLCVILSWLRLRRRNVYPEILSDHTIRLHFDYTVMRPFYTVKLSDHPLTEWHAFATIPDDNGDGPNGYSVVVSNAGDWTKRIINNPPKKLWVRSDPLYGLLCTSRLFKKIIVVATGSGIGPCLSALYADETPRRVLWSAQSPETTYGTNIIRAVQKSDPQAIIWNTRTQGRPDLVAMTYALVLEAQAEAVYIISNPKVTHKVVYGMASRGITAFGAIFDS